jgi:hypothetical protein
MITAEVSFQQYHDSHFTCSPLVYVNYLVEQIGLKLNSMTDETYMELMCNDYDVHPYSDLLESIAV